MRATNLSASHCPVHPVDSWSSRSATPSATPSAAPGSGSGITGLTERVDLAGGSLEHGAAAGEFRLRASLPWPA
jgi:hypothetical protein